MKKTLSIILAILMIVTMLPVSAFAATEAMELKKLSGGHFDYSDKITLYYRYDNYLYSATFTNLKNISAVGLYYDNFNEFRLTYDSTTDGGSYYVHLTKGKNGYPNLGDLPKSVGSSLSCLTTHDKIYIEKDKPVVIITCIAVSEPVWSWNGSSAKAVFTSADGKATMTVNATTKSSEQTTATNCLEKDKTTYTAVATANGKSYTDEKTVYGAAGPHDWSNLDGICANDCGTVCDHASQTDEVCAICGMNLHACDFSGEWKYDSEKHWKECTCGEIDEEAVHTLTEGKCDCGYECPHENWTDGVCDVCGYECLHEEKYDVVTVPATQNADGTWTKATISVVCRECESVIEYKEADRADYTEFDKAMARATELLESGDLTEDKYNHYNSVIGSFKTDSYQGSPFQETADSYADSLEYIVNEIEAGLADGTMKKADWTYMTALLEEVNTLIDNDANNIVPKVIGYYYSPRGFYNGNVNNPNYSQAAYNEAIANNDLENMLETLIAGLKDGTMLKADYTEIDEAIAALDEKLADVNLTDEAKAGLDEIKAELEKLRRNTYASKADLAVLEKALEDYETELDTGIEDGTAVKANYTHIDEVIKDIEEKFADEYLTDERKAELEQIKSDIEKLKADPDTSAADLEGLERSVYNIFTAAEACFNGYHRGLRYELTEEAKCGKNAVESATCSSCGKVLTREVENTALTHSFTKYEVTEEAKCGVEGKEVAYCDNGCGETDEKEIEALEHIPLDAVKENEVDPECEKEGSYDLVVYCDLCGGEISRETFAVDALEHLFLDYIYNEDATCTADGTKTAECVNGCGETDTVTAEDTMLDHADEDGDGICDDCESEIKDVCPDCGGAVHEGQLAEYICTLVTLIKLIVSLVQFIQQFTA